MDDEVSNISTEEIKMHGGGPGQQKFLAYYELASLDVVDSEAWKEAGKGIGANGKIQIELQNIFRESYWLDFTMYAPKR